ncbi:3CxxC-type zinc finger protein [Aspergillus stella-maris]|uniref:3CxxC-type zinc finger protein n=1 Tax=Aspergillus stella-maris TaxID=1810926 RepID=UPI003CCD7C04
MGRKDCRNHTPKDNNQSSAADGTFKMYPGLHKHVTRLLKDTTHPVLEYTFHREDTPFEAINAWDTNVMGRFICRNPLCSKKKWGSKVISMTIREYEGYKYNARVYYQRCKECDNLAEPELGGNDSYEERVVYWLKQWNGIPVQKPNHGGKSNGPHDEERCEGCKAGHCRKARTIQMTFRGVMTA